MSLSPPIDAFIKSFYAASDLSPQSSTSANDNYVNHFLPEAVMLMGAVAYESHKGLHNFREVGWEKVETRKHVIKGKFVSAIPTESGEDEVMVYGYVDYGMKDGTKKEGIEWSARMVLAKVDEQPKLKFYQVYITQK